MNLSDALPRDLIEKKVGAFEEGVTFANAHDFIRGDKKSMSVVGLYVWDQMVARGAARDPRALAKVYPDRLDKMYQFIKRELGEEPITDAFCTKLYAPAVPDYSFVDFSICQCYPGDLHIEDLEFSDISRPLERATKGHGARKYHGLHVFGDFLDRAKICARERGLDRISLMAASPAAHEVFTRYGFVIGDGALAQWTFDNVGMSHPMLLRL